MDKRSTPFCDTCGLRIQEDYVICHVCERPIHEVCKLKHTSLMCQGESGPSFDEELSGLTGVGWLLLVPMIASIVAASCWIYATVLQLPGGELPWFIPHELLATALALLLVSVLFAVFVAIKTTLNLLRIRVFKTDCRPTKRLPQTIFQEVD
jgi:hypothetical protein